MATTEAGGGVPLLEAVTEWLWRVYGYPGDFWEAHPVTVDKYWEDAGALLDTIAAAGYELVPAERMDRLRRIAAWTGHTPAIAADVCRPMVQPGDLDAPGGRE
jgi:hypothetical protein